MVNTLNWLTIIKYYCYNIDSFTLFKSIKLYVIFIVVSSTLSKLPYFSLPFPFLKIEKSVLIWREKALVVSIFVLNAPLKN